MLNCTEKVDIFIIVFLFQRIKNNGHFKFESENFSSIFFASDRTGNEPIVLPFDLRIVLMFSESQNWNNLQLSQHIHTHTYQSHKCDKFRHPPSAIQDIDQCEAFISSHHHCTDDHDTDTTINLIGKNEIESFQIKTFVERPIWNFNQWILRTDWLIECPNKSMEQKN